MISTDSSTLEILDSEEEEEVVDHERLTLLPSEQTHIELELFPWVLHTLPDSLELQNQDEWHDKDDEHLNLLDLHSLDEEVWDVFEYFLKLVWTWGEELLADHSCWRRAWRLTTSLAWLMMLRVVEGGGCEYWTYFATDLLELTLKILKRGRHWPRAEAGTYFVWTSDGLKWVSTFICFPADESVWTAMLTEDDKMAELNSWMTCLIANDSYYCCLSHGRGFRFLLMNEQLKPEFCWLIEDWHWTLKTMNHSLTSLFFVNLPNLNLNSRQSELETCPLDSWLEATAPWQSRGLWSDWHTWANERDFDVLILRVDEGPWELLDWIFEVIPELSHPKKFSNRWPEFLMNGSVALSLLIFWKSLKFVIMTFIESLDCSA